MFNQYINRDNSKLRVTNILEFLFQEKNFQSKYNEINSCIIVQYIYIYIYLRISYLSQWFNLFYRKLYGLYDVRYTCNETFMYNSKHICVLVLSETK